MSDELPSREKFIRAYIQIVGGTEENASAVYDRAYSITRAPAKPVEAPSPCPHGVPVDLDGVSRARCKPVGAIGPRDPRAGDVVEVYSGRGDQWIPARVLGNARCDFTALPDGYECSNHFRGRDEGESWRWPTTPDAGGEL